MGSLFFMLIALRFGWLFFVSYVGGEKWKEVDQPDERVRKADAALGFPAGQRQHEEYGQNGVCDDQGLAESFFRCGSRVRSVFCSGCQNPEQDDADDRHFRADGMAK